jgi:hypothetical protein
MDPAPSCPAANTSGLLLHYDFQTEGCTDIVVDRSGNGHDAKRYGGAVWRQKTALLPDVCLNDDGSAAAALSGRRTCPPDGTPPNALRFDGEVSHATVPALVGGPFSNVTFEFWIQFDTVQGEQVTGGACFLRSPKPAQRGGASEDCLEGCNRT